MFSAQFVGNQTCSWAVLLTTSLHIDGRIWTLRLVWYAESAKAKAADKPLPDVDMENQPAAANDMGQASSAAQ